MPLTTCVTFAAPVALAVATVALAAAAAAAWVRRPAAPVLTYLLCGAGGLFVAVAAGAPVWNRPAAGELLVMVDLSPSTRTARYRDPAALRARVEQLLAGVPYRAVAFSGDGADPIPLDLTSTVPLADLPASGTVFAPPTGRRAVLFSDARFEIPPLVPPVYVVVDPLLESPVDAAIERFEPRGNDAIITVRNSGGPRELALSGTGGAAPVAVPPGPLVVSRPLDRSSRPLSVTARLNPGDAWPENDASSLTAPPPAEAERWWVGAAPPASSAESSDEGTWRFLRPSELPVDAAAFLAPAVVVLDNVAADDLSPVQAQRLAQYVRDLGGGLVILGGDRAFAAGGYAGTPIESLSPLASTPPEPAAHWVLLVDSSGSMNGPAGGAAAGSGATRWRVAADAATALVRSLPPEDRVSVGGFAADVSWWTRGRRAPDAAAETLPPPGAGPGGPTGLRRALEDVTESADPALATHLVLFTDANAELPDVGALAGAMRGKNVRLHLLAIGDPRDEPAGLRAVRQLVADTGGTRVEESDPARWAAAARRLLRRAAPALLETRPVRIRFLGELRALPPRDASPWNRTWLKAGATPSAEAEVDAPGGGARPPLVARWNVGEGSVGAAAFAGPRAAEADALVRLAARAPRDPGLRVAWDAGSRLRVTVDAAEGGRYLNGLDLSLQLDDPARPDARAAPTTIPQTAPGRYELTVDAPRSGAMATVRRGGRTVDRAAVAGRYPPEFDAVGNDRAAMRELARRGGGAVVEPSVVRPLDLAGPHDHVPLGAPLAAAGAACVALGLVWWKAS